MIIQKLFRSHTEDQEIRQAEMSVNENQELIRISQPEMMTLKRDVASSTATELGFLKKSANCVSELESQHMHRISSWESKGIYE